MFKNYFKTAFRNLARNKIYSFINIAGLSIGLACAMLIMLYVKDEVSFDRFHKNVNNIYRIVSQRKDHQIPFTGLLQGPRFKQNVPGIQSFVRVQGDREDIMNGKNIVSQNNILLVDSNFFSVFTFPLLSGDAKTCLTEPHSIVLSEDEANKQFGTTDAVGKIVMIKQDSTFVPFKVTAVAHRCPQNSSILFDMLLPFQESDADAQDTHNWFNSYLNTFVVLNEKTNVQTVEKQMQSFYLKDATTTFHEMLKIDGADPNSASMGTYFLQPYLDMHLNTELRMANGLSNASDPVYSYILSGIALFILLIACINFVNLTIARSVRRAKEVGIRKVVGGERKQLILQFLGESFFLCTIAFVLAIVLAQLLLPLFNDLSNKALSIAYLFDAKLIAGYISLYIITALLSGFYPALVLSGYNPVQTLYGRFNIGGKNYLQKSLVVLQFTLASFLIIATFIIYAQFNFLTKTDLGYDDHDLVIVKKRGLTNADVAIFKNELLKNPDIIGVSADDGGEYGTGTKNGESTIYFADKTIDENYLPLLKIPLTAGRNFSSAFPADSSQSIIVNESFVKAENWKNPIGKTIQMLGSSNQTYTVIGVVKDYHFASLTQKITPELFSMNNSYGAYYIKIKPNTATAGLQWIQKTFQQLYPMSSYAYVFKNDENEKQYADVEKWKQIILFGAILTIFISCIGLFGLSVLSAEKRTKEIGIRKVLGASVQQIVTTLSTDFIKLVILALIIATPLVYIAANKWLQNYPYRIAINLWIFIVAALLVVIVALITISFQSVKAAIANPVKSLRTE